LKLRGYPTAQTTKLNGKLIFAATADEEVGRLGPESFRRKSRKSWLILRLMKAMSRDYQGNLIVFRSGKKGPWNETTRKVQFTCSVPMLERMQCEEAGHKTAGQNRRTCADGGTGVFFTTVAKLTDHDAITRICR